MHRRGFTLLEVLVATLIMAIAVTGLLSNLTTSLTNGAKLTENDRISLMSRRKVDELLITRILPRNIPFEGIFDPAASGGLQCGWRARVSAFDVPPGAGPGVPIVERIEFEAWWMRGKERRSMTLDAYRQGVLQPVDLAAFPPGGQR